jgi:hypothetical protein
VWLEGDLAMLRKCDALFMVPGWAKSTGAIAERDEAFRCHIPVFDDFGLLCAWIQVNNDTEVSPLVE